jgi:hypothetical protein
LILRPRASSPAARSGCAFAGSFSEARQSFGTHAVRELWFSLNLPIVPAMRAPHEPEFPFTYTAIQHEPPDPAPDKDAA